MKCPDCKKKLLCGCKACINKNRMGVSSDTTLLVYDTEETQVCCGCGLILHADNWMEIEGRQHNDTNRKAVL